MIVIKVFKLLLYGFLVLLLNLLDNLALKHHLADGISQGPSKWRNLVDQRRIGGTRCRLPTGEVLPG